MSSTLYFKNSYGERRIVGSVHDANEAQELINKYLERYPHFKSYYTRMWYEYKTDETWFDVGSHTEFFVANGNIMPIDEED